jgi:hypothetical protein
VGLRRGEVHTKWLALVNGQVTREEIHDWTVPWVEGDAELPDDEPLVSSALQTLHGYQALRSNDGSPGYLRSDEDVAQGLAKWRADCSAFDADPAGWRRERFKATLRGLKNDEPDKAPQYGARFVRKGLITEADANEILDAPLTPPS